MTRTRALLRVCALFLPLALLLFAPPGRGTTLARQTEGPHIDSHIARLVESSTMFDGVGPNPLPPDLEAMIDARLMRLDGDGRLQVYVHALGTTGQALEAAYASGGIIERVSDDLGIVQAAVPMRRIRDLASHAGVRYVGLPRYPVLNAGSYSTEGDVELHVDELRAKYDVDGTGIKVGVISNGIWRYEMSQASGDLPAPIDFTTCNAVPKKDPASALLGGEGTAMLEIVHDLAPGAELWFGSFGFGTELDFMAAVTCLAQHVDVVVDDISWFNAGPYNGTSDISANTSAQLNRTSNPIRLYTTSVGNWAQRHWSEVYEACGDTSFQVFRETAQTVARDGSGERCNNPVEIAAGRTAQIVLQWDDPFGGSCNDYDLIVFAHGTQDERAWSTNSQTCTQDPTEMVMVKNASLSESLTVDVAIVKKQAGAQPRRFDMYAINGGPGPEYGPWYYTPAGSVANQSDAGGGVISVAAIDVATADNPEIEPYSSNGPTADGRIKPDISTFDCVNVTGNGYGNSEFCGTSAAAPHIAAIAALLLECNPNLLAAANPGGSAAADRLELRTALLFTANDLGAPGPDNIYGAGLVDPLVTAEAICLISTGLMGDVNCDSGVDAVDALSILQSVAGIEPEARCIILGDVNCDSGVDAVDSLRVLRHVAGFALDIPPGCRGVGT